MDPWKISIYQQLKQRNRWQKDHYELIFDAYITLLSTSRSHRHRSYELEQELSNLRQSMLTGRSPSSSVHTLQEIQSPDGRSSFSQSFTSRSGPALEEKVLKLQEELTAAYRLQSENSNTFLRLKEQAEKDEKALLVKEEEFTKQSQLLKTVQEERDQHAQRIKFMETTIDILRKEVESSRAILLDTEKKVHELANENKILIDQMLKIKQEQARELNQMNDLVTQATRDKELAAQRALEIAKQAEQKHTHVDGVNVEMDISNSNSIIDHVAWQSNFNVTIPTERKRTVRAHRGQVTCVRYNAKGTVLISGGTDGMVKVYDAFRGVCKGSLKGAKESVMNVCISLDDAMVLGAGNDKTARIWALKTGKEMHTLLGHTNKIYAAAFSTDNTKVVTGSHDRTIRIWDLMDGVCKRSILCHSSCNYLSLAPNGNLMASAHMDNHLRFWSLNTGELMHDLSEIHTQQATSCEFSRDGTLIITNSRDSTLKLLDVRTFKVIKTLEGTVKEPYRNAINWNRACFSPDSQYVIAGAASGSIFVWNVDTGKIDSVLPAANPAEHPYDSLSSSSTIPDTAISCVDWNRNGRQIVSADNMGNIHFWE